MKLLKKFIFRTFQLFSLVLSSAGAGEAQPYPQNYFSPPLSVPLRLSGNFGEIRNNHFHSGLDFKTDSVIGKPVLASADGYVSRIKVSASGFGKAIYLNHPNGYTTVYAHLHRFADSLNQFVEQEQYQKEAFETELFPDSSRFRVKKGEQIAWSGNTGGSEGPHLHFEIRNTKSEKPINPLLFGLPVADTIRPVLEKIVIWSGQLPGTNEFVRKRKIEISGIPNDSLAPDTVEVSGSVRLEFSGYDLANGEPNKLGIYQIEAWKEDSVFYSLTQTTFAFDETRYVNAHINYRLKMEEGLIAERCYTLPGDSFSLNLPNKNNRLWMVAQDEVMPVSLILRDNSGNEARKLLLLKGTVAVKTNTKAVNNRIKAPDRPMSRQLLKQNSVNRLKTSTLFAEIPLHALYEDDVIEFVSEGHPRPAYKGQQRHVIRGIFPFHHPYSLSLKETFFPAILRNKACILLEGSGNKPVYIGGTFRADSITVKTRATGTFMVSLDTIPPVISQYEVKKDTLFNKIVLAVQLSDNLSGIASYRGSLDGEWILMEYDDKTGTLFYTCDIVDLILNKCLEIQVSDRRQNWTDYSTVINR